MLYDEDEGENRERHGVYKYIQAARESVSSRERRVMRKDVGECMVESLEA